ncbi:MAG TPA: HlyC/CorC family transporter [Desulfobulbaceae bacterium]|nr:HlyC/CorC family transporter [Desulfobulbaceae bacterium]
MADEKTEGIWARLKALFRFRGAPDTARELENDIQELLEEGEEQGLISSHEERMISSIFDFRETRASEIMTPSAEIVAADRTSSVRDLIRMVLEEGYTRIPLFDTTPDTVIGILHAKDLLRFCGDVDHPEGELSKFFHPPVFIRESTPIIDLLHIFQEKKTHMAIVTDEFGGVRGLVTLEDVIEEIVGEIVDEHDQEEIELRVVEDGIIVVDAKIDREEVERFFSCRLPDGPYESIGGLLLHRLGEVPTRGTEIVINGLLFTVISADKRRIKTVRIEKKQ